MSCFYFDTGIHRFVTKQHNSLDQQKQIDNLISSICNFSGIDLYSGFKSVWAPGLYLERIHLGSKLLKDIIKRVNPITVISSCHDDPDDIFTHIEDQIDKIVDTVIEKRLPLPSVSYEMIGFAGGALVDDLNTRYNDEEKKLLVLLCLKAEAMQQALLDKLKGDITAKRDIQKILFHSCIKRFFDEFFSFKRDINLSRLILMYSSIVRDIEKNSKPVHYSKGKRLIDPNKDIADGELIHFATFGTWVNEELVPVCAVTFDAPAEVRNRLITLKSVSYWALANLKYNHKLPNGKVLCVDKYSHEILVITVEELDIEPWVFTSSSNNALTLLRHEKINLET